MYYLTYRPKTIAELDTKEVRDRVEALLTSKPLPHALLLVGQKGMGKTSTARIIAKAINCERNTFAQEGPSIEPCNNCFNCTSIDKGSHTDVSEIDAASNGRVDDIKNIIRDTALLPMSGRYRVFIIDECHMITTEGFNALLKTLEEPPPHALFILATTNIEKVPKTIVSRCITITFQKAKKEDIIFMLKRILKHEQKDMPQEVLEIVAESSDHSFRDASKLLEELILNKVQTAAEAKKFIGLPASQSLLVLIAEGNSQKIMEWIEAFREKGGSTKQLITDTLRELHEELLRTHGIRKDGKPVGLTAKDIATLTKLLHGAFDMLRVAPIETLPLEGALLEYLSGKQAAKVN